MLCTLLKVLKTAILLTPFYNLYGTVYLKDNEIAAVKLSYVSNVSNVSNLNHLSNNFIITYKDGIDHCLMDKSYILDTHKVDVIKYHNINNINNINTYLIRDYKNIGKDVKDVKDVKDFEYFKCTKSHLHTKRNTWPNSKFGGKIKRNIIKTCFKRCYKYNFFG
jgi:hypothetical protein